MATTRVKQQQVDPPADAAEDHVSRMRRTAEERLRRLFDEAIGARFYGRVMIEVSFEAGRPVLISRRIEGIDK